eukprot:3270438-Prymnesium_polylepis.1
MAGSGTGPGGRSSQSSPAFLCRSSSDVSSRSNSGENTSAIAAVSRTTTAERVVSRAWRERSA